MLPAGLPPPPLFADIPLSRFSLTCFLRRSSASRKASALSAAFFALRSARAFSPASRRDCAISALAPVGSSDASSSSSSSASSSSSSAEESLESEDDRSGFCCLCYACQPHPRWLSHLSTHLDDPIELSKASASCHRGPPSSLVLPSLHPLLLPILWRVQHRVPGLHHLQPMPGALRPRRRLKAEIPLGLAFPPRLGFHGRRLLLLPRRPEAPRRRGRRAGRRSSVRKPLSLRRRFGRGGWLRTAGGGGSGGALHELHRRQPRGHGFWLGPRCRHLCCSCRRSRQGFLASLNNVSRQDAATAERFRHSEGESRYPPLFRQARSSRAGRSLVTSREGMIRRHIAQELLASPAPSPPTSPPRSQRLAHGSNLRSRVHAISRHLSSLAPLESRDCAGKCGRHPSLQRPT